MHYSGTVAVGREAVLHGWPGVAFSQYLRDDTAFDWSRATRWTARVLAELLPRPTEPGLYTTSTSPTSRPMRPNPSATATSPTTTPSTTATYQARRRNSSTDVDTCFGGQIAVTAVRLS